MLFAATAEIIKIEQKSQQKKNSLPILITFHAEKDKC